MTDKIDLNGLREKDIRVIHELVELLRELANEDAAKKENKQYPGKKEIFLTKRLGAIKGVLSRKEVYDYL